VALITDYVTASFFHGHGMGGDPGGMRGTCPLQYLGSPNNLPQNDQVLVLHFNYAFQIRSKWHFCIQQVNFFLLASLTDYW